ncbi:hypothetical protein INQ51_01210 [Maribellus sp. CM-23]|uniref:hypothetical protein n=1 Tax=Maribellus sp. CM-23 TaxID=2781026 RepID=UPI001F40D747|nr:hypothetical protein [Maribellus sp. CM-23]MCE4562915.1 hypothetical protein [Maribellus sp. CM-23]
MKNFLNLSVCALLVLLFHSAAGQEGTVRTYEKPDTRGLYLGGQASTNGFGGTARYVFNNWFSLKTGYETLSPSFDVDFEEYGINYDATLDYKTGGILMLADFNYTRNLYISAGIIFTSFNPEVKGFAVSDYQFGDITIPAEDIGTFQFEIEPQLKAAPYVGAGYQAFLGKANRVVFSYEMGFYYMGAPDLTIQADGLLSPTADPALGHEQYLERQFDAYKIYPILKFNLAVKLF